MADTNRFIVEDGWIERMKNHFGLKLSLDNNYETFMVDTETNDISLYPNISNVIQLGLSYRFLRIGIGYAPRFLPGNGDEHIKGKTRSFYFTTYIFTRHWFQELEYSTVQGYYLKNTADHIPWVEGDPYIQLPDLHYSGISGVTGYNLNPRLSLRSISLQTERQLKSAGSLIAVINYRYFSINDKSEPSPGGATQKSNNVELGIGPGYIYNFVLGEKFYTSLGFTPGLGFIYTKLITRYPSGDVSSTQRNLAFRWNGKAGIGYNVHKFFAGFYMNYTGITYKQENTTVINRDNRVFYQFFVGFRIKAPKGLNRFADSFNK